MSAVASEITCVSICYSTVFQVHIKASRHCPMWKCYIWLLHHALAIILRTTSHLWNSREGWFDIKYIILIVSNWWWYYSKYLAKPHIQVYIYLDIVNNSRNSGCGWLYIIIVKICLSSHVKQLRSAVFSLVLVRCLSYYQTYNISRTIVANKLADQSDVVGKALLQMHIHFRLKTLVQWIRQSQFLDETRNI